MTAHDRYDVQAELLRYRFPDVERNGHRLNRGTARPSVSATEPPEFETVRDTHRGWMVETTLATDSPVIELDQPTTGIYAASRRGVYLDLYLGVAQRLFDDARLAPRLEPVTQSGLLLRREINTDDFLGFAPEGVQLPQDLAALVASEMRRAFPRPEGYSVFFSNSGAEAVEAAIKASTLLAYRRVLERHGGEGWAAVCAELGIELDRSFGTDDPVWRDYPLFLIALQGAFHGRTLGSLALTKSRPVQRIGFPSWRWTAHTSPNDASDLEALIERRPLSELLAEPGALRRVVAAGRVPIDLLAGAIFEPMQGEGGYRMPSAAVLGALRGVCDEAGAQLVADEVQTFARGGTTFYCEGSGVRPDIICLAKAAIVGMTIIPTEVMGPLRRGWHSNTFGSGRLLDVNYAYAAIDTYLNDAEPTFGGLSFAENEQVKGDYLRQGLEALAKEFPRVLSGIEGRGCIWGITVADRPAFLKAGWQRGAKLLGAGAAEHPGRVRLILPADVLTKEIDDVIAVLRSTCQQVSP